MMAISKKQILLSICMVGITMQLVCMEPDELPLGNSVWGLKTGAMALATMGGAYYLHSSRTSAAEKCYFGALNAATVSAESKKFIIWDLGDVLFSPDKYRLTKDEIGLRTLLGYMATGHNPLTMLRRTHELLHRLGQQGEQEEYKLCGTEGYLVSQLYVDVQTSAIPQSEALTRGAKLVNELFENNEIGASEKTVLLVMLRLLFTSDVLKYVKADKEGVCLVEECAGDAQCTQLVLANWNAEAFEDFFRTEEAQKVFRFIPRERCTISGDEKVVKPNPAIFTRIIEKYGLKPENSVVIDDMATHVAIAKECGFNTIHFKDMSFESLREILIDHGYLQSAKAKMNSETTENFG